MVRKLALFFFAFVVPLCGAQEALIPVFVKENFVWGITTFQNEDGDREDKDFLTTTLPLLFLKAFQVPSERVLSEQDQQAIRKNLLDTKRTSIESNLAGYYAQKDDYFFKPPSNWVDNVTLDWNIQQQKDNLGQLLQTDPNVIVLPQTLPLVFLTYNEDELLYPYPKKMSEVTNYDFLMHGTFITSEDAISAKIFLYSFLEGKDIFTREIEGSFDEITNAMGVFMPDIEDALAGKEKSVVPLEPYIVPPPAGYVEILSNPMGAEVLLGSKWEGVTPLRLPRPHVTTELRLRKEGYYDLILALDPEGENQVSYELKLDAGDLAQKFRDQRNRFYISLGIFSASVVIPLISYGLQGVFASQAAQTQGDVRQNALLWANNMNYFLWGGVGLSVVLSAYMLTELTFMIQAGEATLRQK